MKSIIDRHPGQQHGDYNDVPGEEFYPLDKNLDTSI
jgi:hypothetical protein